MWLTLLEAGFQRQVIVNFALVELIRDEPDGRHLVLSSGKIVIVMESVEAILSHIKQPSA